MINMTGGRRHDLDALRVVCFGTVIIYHASLVYGTRMWLVKSTEPSRLIDLIHVGSHPWRMSLLFFVSGLVTASLLSKKSIEDIRKARTRQLLIPFLFGVLLVVPPQFYFSVLKSTPDLTYWAFLQDYFAGGLMLEHMWFLAYLWIYVFVWASIHTRLGQRWSKLSAGLASLLQGARLFWMPIAFFAALRIILYPIFGQTLAVTNDLYAHAHYFAMFFLGTFLINQPRFWQEIDRQRWISAAVAIVSFVALAALVMVIPREQRPESMVIFLRILRAIFQWCSILALLALAGRVATKRNPIITYLNGSMMTYYVMHQTVIVVLAYYLAKANALGLWSFVPLVIATMLICAVMAEAKKFTSAGSGSLMSRLASLRKPPSSAAIG